MCGRYTLRRLDLIKAAFDAIVSAGFEEFIQRPHFNIAPSQHIPLVRINSSGQRVLGVAEWGLVPSWVQGEPKSRPINARAETVDTSGMFRQAFERRRCMIPADGFYEWQGSKPPKQPYFIHMKDDGVFAFAGLWERWKPDDATEPVDTCTILTTAPNDLVRPIHNRMPLILHREDYSRWLDPKTPGEAVKPLLRPYDADEMTAYPITTKVNSVKQDDPDCLQPAKNS